MGGGGDREVRGGGGGGQQLDSDPSRIRLVWLQGGRLQSHGCLVQIRTAGRSLAYDSLCCCQGQQRPMIEIYSLMLDALICQGKECPELDTV